MHQRTSTFRSGLPWLQDLNNPPLRARDIDDSDEDGDASSVKRVRQYNESVAIRVFEAAVQFVMQGSMIEKHILQESRGRLDSSVMNARPVNVCSLGLIVCLTCPRSKRHGCRATRRLSKVKTESRLQRIDAFSTREGNAGTRGRGARERQQHRDTAARASSRTTVDRRRGRYEAIVSRTRRENNTIWDVKRALL